MVARQILENIGRTIDRKDPAALSFRPLHADMLIVSDNAWFSNRPHASKSPGSDVKALEVVFKVEVKETDVVL